MKRALALIAIGASLALVSLASCTPKQTVQEDFLLYDAEDLARVRAEIQEGRGACLPAYRKLLEEADALLDSAAKAVIYKDILPPSGDKHDYMSQGPYWWPDPSKPDGLPYIRRDGERNPEIRNLVDREMLSFMADGVGTLGMAYYFSGDEKYAAKAAEFLRVWFLDPETKMNPNLNYSQRIPGVCDGRGIGCIDVRCFADMLAAVVMLRSSESWTDKDDAALQGWFSEFVTWLTESGNGLNEHSQPNNHGTFYDLQVAVEYMYIGRPDKAREYMESNTAFRFDQIGADGTQPRELARTNSIGYSTMNLRGLVMLAIVGEKLGLDFWNYTNTNGATLRDAIEWYFQYIFEGKPWEYQNISKTKSLRGLYKSLLMSAEHYDAAGYRAVVDSLYARDGIDREKQLSSREYLLYPVN